MDERKAVKRLEIVGMKESVVFKINLEGKKEWMTPRSATK